MRFASSAIGIFLSGLAALYFCVRTKWIRWALYVQGFHAIDHLALATSAFCGRPLGFGTQFDHANEIAGPEFGALYRTAWHIAMNGLPMLFVLIGLTKYWRHGDRAAAESENSRGIA